MGVYKDSTILVDDGIIGIRRRRSNRQGKYYRHPLVRNYWGPADQFRGAQGYYFAKGSYRKQPRLFNFSRHPWWAKNIRRPLKLAGGSRFTNSSFTVYFNNRNWNLANRRKTKVLNNYLSQPTTDAVSGDPNFYQYLAGNLGESSYYKNYYLKRWKKIARFRPLIKLDTEYTDHLTLYRKPPLDDEALEKSDYNVAVNSFYNFYLDTMPPYESVVAAGGRGIELVLPNLYMLESDIHNTASVNYTDQLTLNNASSFYDGPELDVWFLEQNQTSTESGKAYFQQFSEALSAANNGGAIGSIKDEFDSRFKNVAILYPDLEILKKYNIRDDRGTPGDTSDDIKATAFYPFYNEVIVGFDRDDIAGIGGKPASFSFFTSLFASKLDADHVRSFIVFMQLYIIENMRNGDVTNSGYQAFLRESINGQGRVRDSVVSMGDRSDTVFNLGDFLYALKNHELDYLLGVYNESKEEMAEGSNYTILREWEKEDLFKLNIKDAIKVADSEMLQDALEERRRSLKEVYDNMEAPSETLMYLIEKRDTATLAPGGGEPIQTIMISKDVVYSELLRYIDTQVRYGAKYQYSIKQVRMIFGNTYTYDGISFEFGTKKVGQGKAVGNALGFIYPAGQAYTGVAVNGGTPDREYNYLEPGDSQNPAQSQVGHFIFKLSAERSNLLLTNNELPATRASAPSSLLGKYYRAIREGAADLSGLIIELHAGFGTNGADDGGMTAFDIKIPDVIGSMSNAELAQPYEEEIGEVQSALPLYRQAIDILVGNAGGGQGALESVVDEISNGFRRMIEDGQKAKVNGLLAEMRHIRDTFVTTASGAGGSTSLGVNDARSQAARSIYNSVDLKVRETLTTEVPTIPESEETDLTNPLLKEVLGSPSAVEQKELATTFKGAKGKRGMKMRFQ